MQADPARTLRMMMYSASGSIPKEHRFRPVFGVKETLLDACTDPKQLPQWLKKQDLDYYAKEFSRTGFRGGLNWYRTQDLFWQSTPFLAGRKLPQPTLYIGGTDDVVYELAKAGVDNLEQSVPNLWRKVVLPGVGHWTEQEAPAEVNRLTVEFLNHVEAVAPRAAGK